MDFFLKCELAHQVYELLLLPEEKNYYPTYENGVT